MTRSHTRLMPHFRDPRSNYNATSSTQSAFNKWSLPLFRGTSTELRSCASGTKGGQSMSCAKMSFGLSVPHCNPETSEILCVSAASALSHTQMFGAYAYNSEFLPPCTRTAQVNLST
eukprot:1058716-Amphidinium_carterae.2